MTAVSPKTSPDPHNSSSPPFSTKKQNNSHQGEKRAPRRKHQRNRWRAFRGAHAREKPKHRKGEEKKREPPNPPSGGSAPARAPRSPEPRPFCRVSALPPLPQGPGRGYRPAGRRTCAASRPAPALLRVREAEIRPRPRPPGPAGPPFPPRADNACEGIRDLLPKVRYASRPPPACAVPAGGTGVPFTPGRPRGPPRPSPSAVRGVSEPPSGRGAPGGCVRPGRIRPGTRGTPHGSGRFRSVRAPRAPLPTWSCARGPSTPRPGGRPHPPRRMSVDLATMEPLPTFRTSVRTAW